MSSERAGTDRMRIDGIRACIVSSAMVPPIVTPTYTFDSIESVFLELRDEDGRCGYSYLWCFGRRQADLLLSALRYLAASGVRGRTLDAPSLKVIFRTDFNFLGAQGILAFAYSAFDMALHDLHGRRAGVSLGDRLGRLRDAVPAYWSGFFLSQPIGELVADAEHALDSGFTAFKVRVGRPSLDDDLRRVQAIVDHSPAGTRIMLDAVEAWSAPDAIRAAREFERFEPVWLEDPVSQRDRAALREVVDASPIPIATGENEFLFEGLADIASTGAAYLLADLERAGGITSWLRLADHSAAAGFNLTPHFYPHVALQLVAALDQRQVWVEYLPWWDQLMTTELSVSDGLMSVPRIPGIGIDPDLTELARRAVLPWTALGD